MFAVSQVRKTKIDLSLYNYKKDIENRLTLSTFSVFDIKVLEEILYNSIQIPLSNLIKKLETDRMTLLESLIKIQETQLISINNDVICVDKELRKYFETHICKFEENFVANIDFVQNLLKLLPIQILPLWYSLPRSADHIFKSIIEKIFYNSRTYERYLAEINFEDSILNGIIQDLFQSPHLFLETSEICIKYDLTPELFQEYMLQLEYNFVAYISYLPSTEGWTEIITPFGEWKKFLEFKKETFPKSIDSCSIEVYDKKVIEKKIKSYLYPQSLCIDKNNREIEKSLKNIAHLGWIYFEDYLKHAQVNLDDNLHFVLKKQGKSWKYLIPDYNDEQKAYIIGSLYSRFCKQGLIEIGMLANKECFRVTPQGKSYFLSLIL